MTVRAEQEITLTRVDDGEGIESTVMYYQLAASQPATTPDDDVNWVQTEPVYVEGSTDNLYTIQRLNWTDSTHTFGTVQLSSSYAAAKDAYEYAAGSSDSILAIVSEVDNKVEATKEDIVANTQEIQLVKADVDDIAEDVSQELVKRGYAKITSAPSVELGREGSVWKVVITNSAIQLQKNGSNVALLAQDPDNALETIMKSDNARLANIKLRSSDGRGTLGIVAQSNGHVSLKEI